MAIRKLCCSLLQIRGSPSLRGLVRLKHLFSPPTGDELQRAAGIASMMRLPVKEKTDDLDICFVGVPIDGGTCNRPGARFGPRHIRNESVFIRPFNLDTGAAPFESLSIADIGDVRMNIYDMQEAVKDIRSHFTEILSTGCKTIALGGDHTISYPILQAIKDKYGPVGLVHIDAHDDTADHMMGSKIAHGTPFYNAVQEGCLDCDRVVQIGLRGTGYGPDEYSFAKSKGFRQYRARDLWHKSLVPLMSEVRRVMGDGPVYISFDIDSLDPAYAPGTGTPEICGLTPIQVVEAIRGCRGLNVIGCDLVEVSPPYDPSGNTSYLAANLLFELLCVFPGVKYKQVD